MRILFVINNLYSDGNGLCASARRTIGLLRARGLEVRVLSACGEKDGQTPDYPLPDWHMPLFGPLVAKQGYQFGARDKAVIREALAWAELVHLEEPFFLQMTVCRMARRMGVPCVATYHLHPENFFASVGLQRSRWFNSMTLWVWKTYVFDHCRIVQCPTEAVRERLARRRFRAELRVISNGLLPEEHPGTGPHIHRPGEPYNILAVGRYSEEKDQMTLLRAMRYTKNAPSIRLILAGRGPKEEKLRAAAEKLCQDGVLKIPPVFGFYSADGLRELFAQADLYIHCATVEVEGLSCMEAVRTGIVPLIAAGPLTATAQFALRGESVFPVGDAKALAAGIDYWLSDDEARRREAEKYTALGTQYAIGLSIDALTQMYQDALAMPGGR